MDVQPLPGIVYQVLPWPVLAPLARKVRESGIEILHAHDSRGLWIGSWLRRWTGLPLVLSRRIASPVRTNPISARKYSADNLQAVMAVSETVKEEVARSGYPEDRIHVVTDGLDIEMLAGIATDESFRGMFGGKAFIGGIGKLSAKKNWQLLVRVAAHLAAEGHDLRWVVIGEGPERKSLEDLTRSLGVDHIVSFPGFMENAEPQLKSFDLLFHPSLMEGASVTIRTAMVLGVPVVTADAPASVESLGGCGWVVKGDDVQAAAGNILEALSDTTVRMEMCKRARASAVERFSIAETVRGTIEVYEKVLS